MEKVRVWDLPTRLFHGALGLAVLGLAVTGQVGGDAMVWHFRFGYAVFTLLLFRLCWGCVGGHWSRWGQLPLSFHSLTSYRQGLQDAKLTTGHNPAGSWSVLAMLFWLVLQVSTGLVSDDEIANAGPLTALVSGAVVNAATAWHKGLGKFILLALVFLHVGAVVWYLLRKKQNLIPAMVHGDKMAPSDTPSSRDDTTTRWGACFVFLLCVLSVRWVVSLGLA
jgi:cytochrome b